MYVPPAFAESSEQVMLDFVEANPFAALITIGKSPGIPELFATHLPLVLERGDGGLGLLRGHVARANDHRAHVEASGAGSADALVIFTGPNAYITPSWYPSKQEHGRVVPTWNYVAVHAYGRLRFVDDPAFLRRHLHELVQRHESDRELPWSIDDAPATYIEKAATQIVGVEIAIERLEGKWKMSQNRAGADIEGVVRGLSEAPSAAEQAVSEIVDARRPSGKR